VESLIALPLPEALAAAEAAGQSVARVLTTAPPRAGRTEGVPRVVRERHTPDGLELTVALPNPPAVCVGQSRTD
jgi:hypothetical protein